MYVHLLAVAVAILGWTRYSSFNFKKCAFRLISTNFFSRKKHTISQFKSNTLSYF